MHRRVPDKTTAAAPLTPGYLAATATIELDGAGLTGTPAETSEVDGPHAADAKGGDAATSAVRRSAIDGLPSRYAVQERIGIGGSCEVYLADDRELDRVVALKVLRVDRSASADAMRARFLAEAQITARLPHPGVIPVYGRGALPDGRPWFAMKFVRGPTIGDVIAELHAASTPTQWLPTAEGWTFWRLVDALARCCDTMAYAHSMGVVHRDLKPNNVMLGQFGEALVMDWGLAKLLDAPAALPEPQREDETQDVFLALSPQSARPGGSPSGSPSHRTRHGTVVGTPQYMAPEVARGLPLRSGPAVDIWGLGTLLYELLTGNPPMPGDGASALRALRRGEGPLPLRAQMDEAPRIPEALVSVCERAMRIAPSARYPDAGALGAAIRAWLDGSVRREQALAMVAEAELRAARAEDRSTRAAALRRSARDLLRGVRDYDPVERKMGAWAAEDTAAGLELEAAELRAEMLERARSALSLVPELREAHDLLADHHAEQLLSAEAAADSTAAVLHEQALRQHDGGRHAGLLRGEATLWLRTEPPGAQVEASRLVRSMRRIIEEPIGPIGTTNGDPLTLRRGSYLLTVRGPGCEPVRLHVRLQRSERWSLHPPGAETDLILHLPPAGTVGADAVWVPPGWFEAGGDSRALDSLPATRVWVDGFVMDRAPVTNARWLAYVNALIENGDDVAAAAAVPRRPAGEGGGAAWVQGTDGRYALPQPRPGDDLPWRPGGPVVRVTFAQAEAWCRWSAAQDGLPWRLPHELEWEKAARGVDGRAFPWGDHVDGNWACTASAHAETASIAEVGAYPTDRSPWGLQDMAGNAQCWCDTPWSFEGHGIDADGRLVLGLPAPDEPRRIIRGGAWNQPAQTGRCANRLVSAPDQWWGSVGVRRVRSVERPRRG